jgi:hypothetical protein
VLGNKTGTEDCRESDGEQGQKSASAKIHSAAWLSADGIKDVEIAQRAIGSNGTALSRGLPIGTDPDVRDDKRALRAIRRIPVQGEPTPAPSSLADA